MRIIFILYLFLIASSCTPGGEAQKGDSGKAIGGASQSDAFKEELHKVKDKVGENPELELTEQELISLKEEGVVSEEEYQELALLIK